jgi:carboxymethylenebutenolidase
MSIPVGSLTRFSDTAAGGVYAPADGRRRGLILVCHERYGLVQHTLDLAQRFSDEGYVAIAPDFFAHWDGDREALAAGDIQVELDDKIVQQHLRAAITYGVDELCIHPDRVAAIGVCQSGSYSLLATEVHPRLAAALVLYGAAGERDVSAERLRPYAELLPQIRCPVLGIWGEADHVVSLDQMLRLRGLLEAADVSYEFTLFPGMPHGWLNSTMPGRYRPDEAEAVWSLMSDFIERGFAGHFAAERRVWKMSCDTGRLYDFSKNVRLA